MSNNLAVEVLMKNREELVGKRTRMLERYNKEISEIETALEQLAGKKVWEMGSDYHYDDENPDQIKQSIEEI
jgi:hypothetical protein